MTVIRFNKRILTKLLAICFLYLFIHYLLKKTGIFEELELVKQPSESNIPPFSEKWVIIIDPNRNHCLRFCKVYPSWNVVCLSKDIVLPPRMDNCQLFNYDDHQHGNKSKQSQHLEIYLRAIESGAKYVHVYRSIPKDQYELSPVNDLIDLQPLSNFSLSQPNLTFDDCGDESFKLPFAFDLCRTSRKVFLYSPVASISCSADFQSARVPSQQYLNFDLFQATLGYDALWALVFHDHYEDLKERDKEVFLCFVQRYGWNRGGQVEAYYSDRLHSSYTFSPKKSFNHKCQNYDFMSDDIVNFKSYLVYSEAGDYNYFEGVIKHKLIKLLSEIFSNMDRELITRWFDGLTRLHYRLFSADVSEERADCVAMHYHPTNRVFAMFDLMVVAMDASSANLAIRQKTHKQVCGASKVATGLKNAWMQKNDVTVIIVFNNPHYEVIPLLELIYRSTYPSIIYCGPVMIDYHLFRELSEYKLSFVQYQNQHKNETKGALNYQCLLNVLNMKLNTQGYLVLADDLLILSHGTEFLDMDKPWFIPAADIYICDLSMMKMCIMGLCEFNAKWVWWEDYRVQSLNALRDIDLAAAHSKLFRNCSNAIKTFAGGKKRIFGGYSDIYYLPKKLSKEFYELGHTFLKHGVFVEIAVPTIFRCLAGLGHEAVELNGRVQWSARDRDLPWEHFKKDKLLNKHFFHPLKLSLASHTSYKFNVSKEYMKSIKDGMPELEKGARLKDFFCSVIIPYVNELEYSIPE